MPVILMYQLTLDPEIVLLNEQSACSMLHVLLHSDPWIVLLNEQPACSIPMLHVLLHDLLV